jgi:hypothetical protein
MEGRSSQVRIETVDSLSAAPRTKIQTISLLILLGEHFGR